MGTGLTVRVFSPCFATTFRAFRHQSAADLVVCIPIVSGTQRAAFEQYSLGVKAGWPMSTVQRQWRLFDYEIFPFPDDNATDALFDIQGYYAPL
jgi:hypothetical protein